MAHVAGKAECPLADLPRWRMEALLRTHVCDMDLYRNALTVPAAVTDPIGRSLERLEFLGDAVLEVVIRDYVYTKCARHPACQISCEEGPHAML
jgi:dsRNA-specific ribonuclease